ncbi:MAG: hypothetical protein AAGD25_16225 [Cyanobacteria bacterium P01_F01_bin.150]
MAIVEIGQILQDIGNYGLTDLFHVNVSLFQGHLWSHTEGYVWGHPATTEWIILAQQFDTDPFSGIREWFGNLIATGQLWALIIGFILGYLFRGFTSYG